MKTIKIKTSKTARVIDVRRPEEFANGHAKKSINIPLNEIPERLDEIREMKSPVTVVCGGGTRHVKAYELLLSEGIPVQKGGSWKSIEAR